MRFQPLLPNEILLKYSISQYPLIYEYLVNRNYINNNLIKWYECVIETGLDSDMAKLKNNFRVIGLIAVWPSHFLPKSLHISAIEVEEKSKGYGTLVMNSFIYEFQNYLSITLQVSKPELESFYKKFGFKMTKDQNGVPYMRKYL